MIRAVALLILFSHAAIGTVHDWMGQWHIPATENESSGWHWNDSHGWVYRWDENWIMDQQIGWFWSSEDMYPVLYGNDHGWLYFEPASSSPTRWLYSYDLELWFREDDRNPPARDEIELSSTDNQVLIYNPGTGNNGVLWTYKRTVNQKKDTDIWEIYGASYTKRSGGGEYAEQLPVTSSGSRIEHAIMIPGDTDFSGGSIHGFEKTQSITFYVDGIETSPNEINGIATTLKVVQHSILHRWNTGIPLAEIATETTFTADQVELKHDIVWLVETRLQNAYLAMFPVLRTWMGIQVSTYEQRIPDAAIEVENYNPDVGTAGFTTQRTTGTSEVVLSGGSHGLTFRWVEIVSVKANGSSFVSSSPSYNKIYKDVRKDVTVGEKWHAHHRLSIEQ